MYPCAICGTVHCDQQAAIDCCVQDPNKELTLDKSVTKQQWLSRYMGTGQPQLFVKLFDIGQSVSPLQVAQFLYQTILRYPGITAENLDKKINLWVVGQILEDLRKKGIVKMETKSDGQTYYSLTQKGIKYHRQQVYRRLRPRRHPGIIGRENE